MAKTEYEYRYYNPDDGETEADAKEFTSSWSGTEDFHDSWIAEEAAEYDHDHHDGWEASWPRVFVILNADGTERGRFEVDRESVPKFHAARVR